MHDTKGGEMVKIKIKEVRESKGILQKDLCELADVSKPKLVSLESGKHDNPTVQTLLRIAKALGVRVTDIVDFED